MRETSFIRQNKDKWKDFERTLSSDRSDPDKLNDIFIQITDDLSYSRTFYPNRSVRVYLNNLAQKIFYKIYKNKKTRLGRIIYFWTDELPQLVYESRISFRVALIVFATSFVIGAFSSAMDPEFPRAILGDAYVDMTIENIESGDPMAVYKQRGSFSMSLGITANNLYVAFLTFILGVFFAVGSAAIMVSNGIMVGAFQYFFYQQGLLQESFLTIWIHGTLEISAIIIAGAAGLTMGRGIVFPGTLTRLQSFQISARRGLKIMIGIAPIIILAGFIEGYLTRYTGTPDVVRALFILLCLSFVLGYFVWYPRHLAKRGFRRNISDTQLPPNANPQIDFVRIKTAGEIFADIFVVYKKYFKQISLTALAAAVVYCGLAFPMALEPPAVAFTYPNVSFSALDNIGQFFRNDEVPILVLINTFIYSIITFAAFTYLRKEQVEQGEEEKQASAVQLISGYLKVTLAMGCLAAMMYLGDWYIVFLLVLAGPFFLIWAYVMYEENANIFSGLGRTFGYMSAYGRGIGLYVLVVTISGLFYFIMDTSLMELYFDFISWNLSLEEDVLEQVGAILLTFVSIFVICLLFSMMALGGGLLYHTMREIQDAPDLIRRVQSIGSGRRIQGLEREDL
ncbi:MAG: stage II sporulation protein M [Bacteroidota bacterium]